MDNNTTVKKQYKLNPVDILLIVIILGAVIFLMYMIVGNKFIKAKNNVTILYTIEIPLIKNELLAEVLKNQPGDKIIDSVRSYDIGSIESIKYEDAYVNTTNKVKGIIERKPYPEHSKMLINIRADAEKLESKYLVSGKIIMVGVRIDFRTPHLINYGYCTGLVEIEKNADNTTAEDTTTGDVEAQ